MVKPIEDQFNNPMLDLIKDKIGGAMLRGDKLIKVEAPIAYSFCMLLNAYVEGMGKQLIHLNCTYPYDMPPIILNENMVLLFDEYHRVSAKDKPLVDAFIEEALVELPEMFIIVRTIPTV